MPPLQVPRLPFSMNSPVQDPEGTLSNAEAAARIQRINELESQVKELQTALIQSDTSVQNFCSTTSSLYATLKQFVEEADDLGAEGTEHDSEQQLIS